MFPSLSFHFLPVGRLCITKIHDYITVIDVGSREVAFFDYRKCCSTFASLILHVVWHQRQNAFYTLGPRLAMTVATSVPVTQAWMRVEQYLLEIFNKIRIRKDMISQCWVLLAIALFHYHVFCTRFRRIPAHDRWHLQRKQVAACTMTFRGPGAGICRRQLRSALWEAFST